jgi:hypothetical protein
MLIAASERIGAKGEGVRLNCCSIPSIYLGWADDDP